MKMTYEQAKAICMGENPEWVATDGEGDCFVRAVRGIKSWIFMHLATRKCYRLLSHWPLSHCLPTRTGLNPAPLELNEITYNETRQAWEPVNELTEGEG